MPEPLVERGGCVGAGPTPAPASSHTVVAIPATANTPFATLRIPAVPPVTSVVPLLTPTPASMMFPPPPPPPPQWPPIKVTAAALIAANHVASACSNLCPAAARAA